MLEQHLEHAEGSVQHAAQLELQALRIRDQLIQFLEDLLPLRLALGYLISGAGDTEEPRDSVLLMAALHLLLHGAQVLQLLNELHCGIS